MKRTPIAVALLVATLAAQPLVANAQTDRPTAKPR
jgi:hypothetical protein